MFFQITNLWQILGWCLVFAGLIILNEIGRKSKAAKVFACIGLALIVVYVVTSVNIKLSKVPILEWIGILFLIVVGALFTWAGVSGKQLKIKK